MKFEGYCLMEQVECQNGKTIGQKAGNKKTMSLLVFETMK